jgi:hypothetical protein
MTRIFFVHSSWKNNGLYLLICIEKQYNNAMDMTGGDIPTRLKIILSQWVRLGAMFHVRSASRTPDIETLLIDTSRVLPAFPRLFAMMVSWLVRYHRLICRHRLAALAERIETPESSAVLGYVLTAAGRLAQSDHFNLAVKLCRPLSKPQPLFNVYRRNSTMTKLARRQADPLGIAWGLWAPPERLYDDAIQPPAWVMDHNPSLKSRAMFGGQLAASILTTLKTNPGAGKSESALSRACRATRRSVRDALEHLELCRLIERQRLGVSVRISVLT